MAIGVASQPLRSEGQQAGERPHEDANVPDLGGRRDELERARADRRPAALQNGDQRLRQDGTLVEQPDHGDPDCRVEGGEHVGSAAREPGSAGLAVDRRVRAGTYGVNTYTMDFAAPFGGYKASGIGREFGPEGLSHYTELKSIYKP